MCKSELYTEAFKLLKRAQELLLLARKKHEEKMKMCNAMKADTDLQVPDTQVQCYYEEARGPPEQRFAVEAFLY